MGLLDFIGTPEGQGLLAAAFGGMAGARKGEPINSLGKAGLAGVMGYSNAINQQDKQAENAMQNKIRQMQMAEMERKQAAMASLGQSVPEQYRPFVELAPDAVVKSMFKEPEKAQLVTVQTPQGPMQRWMRPGEAAGVDIGAPVDKESALPWYAKKGPDGRLSIDPAFAELEKTKAAYGRAPAQPMAPVAYVNEQGQTVWGTITDAKGKPAANFSPTLQGKIAEAKKLGQETGEQKSMLSGKQDALASVQEAKKMLDQGIYTGAYANLGMKAEKFMPLGAKEKAARTEEFKAYIGNTVVPRLKEFGGNDSNEEMRYLQGIMGGDITMEDKALKKILADAELKIRRGIDRIKSPEGDQNGPAQPDFAEAARAELARRRGK